LTDITKFPSKKQKTNDKGNGFSRVSQNGITTKAKTDRREKRGKRKDDKDN
jgi:hypothetical protein